MSEETTEEEYDPYHAFCTDCGKRFPDSWAEKNPFLQAGNSPSCPACGGVVAVMDERRAAKDIAKDQAGRGIPGK